jgi:hypothetical protein
MDSIQKKIDSIGGREKNSSPVRLETYTFDLNQDEIFN